MKPKILEQRKQIDHMEAEISKVSASIKKLLKENSELEKAISAEELLAEEKRPKNDGTSKS